MASFMSIFNTLQKFPGEGDLATWLEKFNNCCALANKEEDDVKGKLVILCLTGQALAVVEQLSNELEGAQTLAQVRARLESVFDTPATREQKMVLFDNRVLKVDESLDEFMLDLVQLYRGANPNASNAEQSRALKRKFMQGILLILSKQFISSLMILLLLLSLTGHFWMLHGVQNLRCLIWSNHHLKL